MPISLFKVGRTESQDIYESLDSILLSPVITEPDGAVKRLEPGWRSTTKDFRHILQPRNPPPPFLVKFLGFVKEKYLLQI